MSENKEQVPAIYYGMSPEDREHVDKWVEDLKYTAEWLRRKRQEQNRKDDE